MKSRKGRGAAARRSRTANTDEMENGKAKAAFFAPDWNKMRKNKIKNYKTEKMIVIRCGRGILKLKN